MSARTYGSDIRCTTASAGRRSHAAKSRLRNETHKLGPDWAQRLRYVEHVSAHRRHPAVSIYAHELTRALIRRSGGQGVASSNLACSTKPIHPIRPSRTCIQPKFLPASITPSGDRFGPATTRIYQMGSSLPLRECGRGPQSSIEWTGRPGFGRRVRYLVCLFRQSLSDQAPRLNGFCLRLKDCSESPQYESEPDRRVFLRLAA